MLSTYAFAQTPPTSEQPTENNLIPGHYYIDNNLNKFVGTWRWSSGLDTVIINLKKMKHIYSTPPTPAMQQDWLYGGHIYIKNGQVVESSMQYINSTNPSQYNIVGYSNLNDSTKADLLFGDISKRRTHFLKLQFLIGVNPKRLVWHTDYRTSVNALPGMTLPRDMVLTKQ